MDTIDLGFNLKSLVLPCEAELTITLLFSNVIFEANESVVYLTDLPEGKKVQIIDTDKY